PQSRFQDLRFKSTLLIPLGGVHQGNYMQGEAGRDSVPALTVVVPVPAPGGVSRPGSGCGSCPGSGCGSRPGSGCVSHPGSGCGSRPGSGCVSRPGSGCGSRPGSGCGSCPDGESATQMSAFVSVLLPFERLLLSSKRASKMGRYEDATQIFYRGSPVPIRLLQLNSIELLTADNVPHKEIT
uniref:Uncharacterized protein n=1 Tax=Takifugu rubripes TaxID=31033 RepID=A0A674MAJ5_TAKRU